MFLFIEGTGWHCECRQLTLPVEALQYFRIGVPSPTTADGARSAWHPVAARGRFPLPLEFP